MKLFALFLVFGLVVCAWCGEADSNTEKKKDIKAKLADLSKVRKRAKDYNDYSTDDYTTKRWKGLKEFTAETENKRREDEKEETAVGGREDREVFREVFGEEDSAGSENKKNKLQ